MASSRKQCVIGNDCKQSGVAHCEGCSQAFCIKHFNDHRRSLDEEMNIVMSEYNDFKNTLVQAPNDSCIEPLIKEIDDWEIASLEKIQQKAAESRQRLLQFKATHIESLSTKLQPVAEQIKIGREQDDYTEIDLRRWRKRLNDLQSYLISPSTIVIDRHNNIPLVSDISVSFLSTGNELFDRVADSDVQIEEDGEVAVAVNYITKYNEIRGKNDYAFGCHTVRVQIAHLSKQWTYLGINSKLIPLRKSSYQSKSGYGWCSSNYIYSNGTYEFNKTNPPIEMNMYDVITLIFDCANRKISMINERTDVKHELIVDINNCPFPWQLHAILLQHGSRIRILST